MKEAHEKAHTILHSQALPVCPKDYTCQRRPSVYTQSTSCKQAAFPQLLKRMNKAHFLNRINSYVFLPWESMTLDRVYYVVHMTTYSRKIH